ncbi:MAG: ABC transporter permease [Candidatus Aminicenantes bacterium]|nr:ABC transporter permease [Candidatus Aminicenantes bacterium]
MLKNYIKIALRNIRKQKGYSVLNFLGLTIGLSVTLVITLYVLDDLRFDKFHENKDQIYRILSIGVKRGTVNSITTGPLVQYARENIPEVLNATRVTRGGRAQIGPLGTNFSSPEGQTALRAETIFADTQFFDVFSFNVIQGDSGQALNRPDSVFLTPKVAQALFGEKDPIGQPIAVRGMENAKVMGIVESPPVNSHIQFEMILPLIPEDQPQMWNSWETLALVGYVLLDKNSDPDIIVSKIMDHAYKNNFPEIFEPKFQPLLDIHLGSSENYYDNLNAGRSDKVVFYTMAFIGILVLLVACINFINLTTSRSSQRAKEVGLRKVIGSSKRQLVGQFLGESVLFTLLTFFAALCLVEGALPVLNSVMKKSLSLVLGQNLFLIFWLFITVLIIGILSGLYPAFVITAYKPVFVLRGQFTSGKKGVFLRKFLVVFQFTVTTVLIICVFIVIAQIKFLKSIDLGYNRSRVVAIPNPLGEGDDLLKDRLLALPSVVSAGRLDALPGPNFWRFELIREGFDRSENFTASRFNIDVDTFKVLEISMSSGRNFSDEFPSDAAEGIIVNETLVRKFEYDEPLGKTLRYYDENNNNSITSKKIIGVIKDFHYLTARQKSEPMIFLLNPRQGFFLMVRIAPGQTAQTLPQIQEQFKILYPNGAFQYSFLDETFDEQFNQDKDFMRNICLFAGLALFIACLGLIGLIAFTIEQRKKEIAIRKVLGCGEGKVYAYLAQSFIKWVLLANLIAWPVSYFATRTWLNDFVFRIPLQPWTFLLATLVILFIAILTISLQTFNAVRRDPVHALREF